MSIQSEIQSESVTKMIVSSRLRCVYYTVCTVLQFALEVLNGKLVNVKLVNVKHISLTQFATFSSEESLHFNLKSPNHSLEEPTTSLKRLSSKNVSLTFYQLNSKRFINESTARHTVEKV